MKRKWQYLLIALLCAAAYHGSPGNGYLSSDDYDNIVENGFIKDASNLPELLGKDYYTLAQEKTYRPVTTLSYFLNHMACGLNLPCWRVVNILLHAANSLLVYVLVFFSSGRGAKSFSKFDEGFNLSGLLGSFLLHFSQILKQGGNAVEGNREKD